MMKRIEVSGKEKRGEKEIPKRVHNYKTNVY